MRSLKISNILGNEDELKKRLRGIQSPAKRKLLKAISENDYKTIITELLFRIELYTKAKVLNYTRPDIKMIVESIANHGVNVVSDAVFNKYYSADKDTIDVPLNLIQGAITDSEKTELYIEAFERISNSDEFYSAPNVGMASSILTEIVGDVVSEIYGVEQPSFMQVTDSLIDLMYNEFLKAA